jgi:hypothetical protein
MFLLHFDAGAGSAKLLKFFKWFWSILEKMPMAQRQDLVSFIFGTFIFVDSCNLQLSGHNVTSVARKNVQVVTNCML